jgi:REP-associated tyrosine transposase
VRSRSWTSKVLWHRPSACASLTDSERFSGPVHFFLEVYRRNLPHWHPHGAAVFVTWRLIGCVPRRSIVKLSKPEDAGRAFRDLDVHLDRAEFGPTWLAWPPIGECLVEIIGSAGRERGLCDVHAFVVMPNHVHVLITPLKPLCAVTKWIKGASARRANRLLSRTGEPFWQDESFDHWVRNRAQFEKIREYIWNNPAKEGLVTHPSDWPYSDCPRRAQAEGLCHG